MLSLEERAWLFAMNAHASIQQKRKYTGLPYITHPGEVATILRTLEHVTESMLCAAWVHDTVEDVPGITFAAIESELGPEVAHLVREVTCVSAQSNGNRKIRKALDRAHYAKASAHGQTLKLADMISNISTLPDLDPAFAQVYLNEAAQLLDVLVLADPVLIAQAKACLLRGFRTIEHCATCSA